MTTCTAEEAVEEVALEAGGLGRTRTLGRLVKEDIVERKYVHILQVFFVRLTCSPPYCI